MEPYGAVSEKRLWFSSKHLFGFGPGQGPDKVLILVLVMDQVLEPVFSTP